MSALQLQLVPACGRFGVKGPRAEAWLTAHGLELPATPNTWSRVPVGPEREALWVARLGSSEFFIEEGPAHSAREPVPRAHGETLRRLATDIAALPEGVYPVLREDTAFLLSGENALDVLAQVCNVNFAQIPVAAQSVIMTLMIGVSVLVLPEAWRYRIWCDPSFGSYLEETLGNIVIECGGYRGTSA